MQQDRGEVAAGCLIVGGVVGLITLLVLVFGTFVTVGVGEVGIVRHFGAVDVTHPDTFEPGFHFKMPFRDDVVVFTTRVVRSDIDKVSAASKDGITVTTHLVINYHIDGKNAPLILQNVGANYENTVLAPAIQQAYKDITGTYAALEMIQKRQEVADKATSILGEKMKTYYILIDQVSIVNLDFPQAFDDAIQATQIANQNRAKAQQDQERARIEAQTALIQAEGLANAQKAQAQTITPAFLELQAIQKWDGHLPQYLTPGAALPFLGTGPTGGAR